MQVIHIILDHDCIFPEQYGIVVQSLVHGIHLLHMARHISLLPVIIDLMVGLNVQSEGL